MPEFTFTSPEGKSYSVTGPEGATKEQAFQILQQSGKLAEAAAPTRSTAADVAIESAKGLGRGLTAAAGDIGEAVMGPFGPGKHAASLVADIKGEAPPKPDAPYSQQINKAAGIEASGQTIPGKLAGGATEMLGNPVTYLGPGGIAGKVLTGAAAGAGSEAAGEAAQSMGAGPGMETAARVAGAVAGGKAPSVGARAITPLPSTAERQAAVQTLAHEGIDAQTAGQTTGSKSTQYAESLLGDAPGAGGRATAAQERVGRQFTAAALRRAGIHGEELATPQVIDAAFDRIGGDLDAIAARNSAVQDHQFIQDMIAARAEYEATVQQGSRRAVVDQTINDFTDRLNQSPIITGEQYQRFRSRLTRLQRGAAADPEYSEVLSAYVEAMDDMMARSITNPGDMQAWQEARRQYRNLIPLARASTGAGEFAAEGIITPQRLRSVIAGTQRGIRDYARGRGDFAELTRAGNLVLTQLPNSGTAQRELARVLTTGAGTAAGFLAGGGGPEVSLGVAGGMAAPGGAGRALMSPLAQGYLANQVIPADVLQYPITKGVLTSPLATNSPLAQPTQ